MKYNHISFNAQWASSLTEDAFVEHEKHHGMPEEQLREAHKLIMKSYGDNKKSSEKSSGVQSSKNSGQVAGSDKGSNSGSERPANDHRDKK